MATLERDFKGVWIPREIWLEERLSALEKVILLEVDSLDNGEGCWAGNDYLAEFCQCSERKVSDTVSKLTRMGYLKVISFDGRRRFLSSCVAEKVRETSRKCEAQSQKVRAININNNINNNSITLTSNTYRGKTRGIEENETFTKPTLDELQRVITDKGYDVDAEEFLAFYDSNGWKVGKNPMKSWKSALVTWHKRRRADAAPADPTPKYERF